MFIKACFFKLLISIFDQLKLSLLEIDTSSLFYVIIKSQILRLF